MTRSHLNLPWAWDDCNDVSCQKMVHWDAPAEETNTLPREWVEASFMNYVFRTGSITKVDADGNPHNEDGPAIESRDGAYEWRHHGDIHRVDGPALILPSGAYAWYFRNERHRDDGGPAESYTNGDQIWWVNGVLHRDDGPAVLKHNGTEEWWKNGVRVRKALWK